MRFAILSSGNGWHVRDLQRAALQLGQEAVAVDFRRLSADAWSGAGLGAFTVPMGSGARAGDKFDGVLVRTMPPGSLEQVIFRMDLLHRTAAGGIPVLNPPAAVEACVDKYLTSARLAGAGLPVPPTIVCQNADAAMEAFSMLGADVVVKPLFGSEGRGMMHIDDADLAWRTFRTLERTQSVLYLQGYVRHPGWDVRAFLIDGEVVAAMRRRANGCWRTNVAQGGKAEVIDLSARQRDLAVRAADILGTRIAGVDLLPGPDDELFVLEVNAVPGWRALAAVAGIDIASLLLRTLIKSTEP